MTQHWTWLTDRPSGPAATAHAREIRQESLTSNGFDSTSMAALSRTVHAAVSSTSHTSHTREEWAAADVDLTVPRLILQRSSYHPFSPLPALSLSLSLSLSLYCSFSPPCQALFDAVLCFLCLCFNGVSSPSFDCVKSFSRLTQSWAPRPRFNTALVGLPVEKSKEKALVP